MTSPDGSNPRTLYYYFNGQRIGEVTNDGASDTVYDDIIDDRDVDHDNRWRWNSEIEWSDFDQAYDTIDPTNSGEQAQAGVYVTRSGDTLASVAAAMWGDALLRYMIEEANGLSSSSQLAAGMRLSIPNKVANFHNTAETFRPYDPAKALGNVMPTLRPPPPPPPAGKCGIAQVVVAIVAIAVALIVAPQAIAAIGSALAPAGATVTTAAVATSAASGAALATTAAGVSLSAAATTVAFVAGGAIAGAAASIVSQGVGLAIGAQDKVSWKAVGISAVAGGISGGMGRVGALRVPKGSTWSMSNAAKDFARGAITNAGTQVAGF